MKNYQGIAHSEEDWQIENCSNPAGTTRAFWWKKLTGMVGCDRRSRKMGLQTALMWNSWQYGHAVSLHLCYSSWTIPTLFRLLSFLTACYTSFKRLLSHAVHTVFCKLKSSHVTPLLKLPLCPCWLQSGLTAAIVSMPWFLLSKLLTPHQPSRSFWSAQTGCLHVPHIKWDKFGHHSFSGSSVWNALLPSLCTCITFDTSKSVLKTHLFQEYYLLSFHIFYSCLHVSAFYAGTCVCVYMCDRDIVEPIVYVKVHQVCCWQGNML